MDEAEKRAHHATAKWNTKESHGGGSEWFHVPKEDDTEFRKKLEESVTNKKGKTNGLISLLKSMMRMI